MLTLYVVVLKSRDVTPMRPMNGTTTIIQSQDSAFMSGTTGSRLLFIDFNCNPTVKIAISHIWHVEPKNHACNIEEAEA